MAIATRTTNPLPFQDLEPRRFEDLVRQLAYDFRQWRQLEPTGRSGSDDSFDIRGWEVFGEEVEEPDPEEPEQDRIVHSQDRVWLIQCKREKAIGPTKLGGYVDAIPMAHEPKIYGVIIAAACDFSKAARDKFRERCIAGGFQEFYLWSKSEIEDMLFQPKNDHLLFAYFNISLTIRRRSATAKLRARLATKRKMIRAFGDGEYVSRIALFIDPSDDNYPVPPKAEMLTKDLPWKIYRIDRYHPRGIIVETRELPAYLHDDGVQWDVADAAPKFDLSFQHPWVSEEEEELHARNRHDLFQLEEIWPHHNRARIKVSCLIEYEDIVDIDRAGDTLFDDPIIYVPMAKGEIPWSRMWVELISEPKLDTSEPGNARLVEQGKRLYLPDNFTNRIAVFPAKFRRTY